MKKILVKAFILLLVVMTTSCMSNRKLTDSKSIITPLSGRINVSDGSVIYGLPLTVIDVKVITERVIERPGPYARYAEDLLGLKDVVRTESERWKIKGITIQTHEELDPSEFYVIEANTLYQTNVLALKKAGLIMDLNPDFFAGFKNNELTRIAEVNGLNISDLGADEYYMSRNDTAYKLVNVDTAFIRIPYLVEKKQKLTLDQLADRAARRLMEMRDGKHLILTGEANVFPQNEASINEMNRLEKEYTELFTGKTWKETITFSYQMIPVKDMTGKKVTLMRFSDDSGPVETSATGGIPLTVEFLPEMKTKELTLIDNRQSSQSSPLPGRLFYRVPDVVTMKLTIGNDVLGTSRRLIYQYGTVVQLPSNFIIGK